MLPVRGVIAMHRALQTRGRRQNLYQACSVLIALTSVPGTRIP